MKKLIIASVAAIVSMAAVSGAAEAGVYKHSSNAYAPGKNVHSMRMMRKREMMHRRMMMRRHMMHHNMVRSRSSM